LAEHSPSSGATRKTPSATSWDGLSLYGALRSGSAWLDVNVEMVNALNVFPVPDGDTGTNMSLTMRAALQEAEPLQDHQVGRVARVIADGALMGARGNSGVILSQVLRGMARSLDGKEELDAVGLADALEEGATTAYKGVMKPVEGTILTVAREAAEAARHAADKGESLIETLETTVEAARASLRRTPHLLPVLAEAGVVDAGGQGLLMILEGALRYVRGEPITTEVAQPVAMPEHSHAFDEKYNYDTQFIIQGRDLDVDAIREYIAGLGDSVLVVGDTETVKVHVHCDNPAPALDYGLRHGSLSAIIIENMQLQVEARRQALDQAPQESGGAHTPPKQETAIAVIAVTSGEGLQRVFESLGASAVVPGGQTMNPSTQDLLSAIERVEARKVVLLPNNGNIILAAQQARELSDKEVVVVPTRTVPQGIAALLAYNFQADLQENARYMEQASARVLTLEVTRAVRSVQVNGMSVREGQIIGLVDGDLKMADDTASHVVLELLGQVDVDEYEILTIYYGEDIHEEEAQSLAQDISGCYPNLEVEVLSGGQPHYFYIISVE